MKVIMIATITTTFFLTINTPLNACPTIWGLHQHTCQEETIQTETNSHNYLTQEEVSQNEDDEDD